MCDTRSGQVLVEGIVGLALLTFVWALIAFSTFIATNHIRTAMAARHAAWQKGNGIDPSVDDIEKKFFYQAGLVKVETGDGLGIGNLISGANVEETCSSFQVVTKVRSQQKCRSGLRQARSAAQRRFPSRL